MSDQMHKSYLPGWLRAILVSLAGLVVFIVALLGLGCFAYLYLPPFPSDAELMRRFDQNQSCFNELIKMSSEDKTVFRYQRARKDWTPQEINEPRASVYKMLLRKVGGLGLMDRDPANGNVFFVVESRLDGDVKGFAYLRTRPHFVETSLDDCLPFWCWSYHHDPTISDRRAAFRELRDGWYLWREIQFFD